MRSFLRSNNHLENEAILKAASNEGISENPNGHVKVWRSERIPPSPFTGRNYESNLKVRIIDFLNDERIIPFLSSQPDSLIFHHPAWLTALQEESGQRCYVLGCESGDGILRGLMPLAYTRGLPFNISNHQTKRRICSLPRTPFAGPISTSAKATELLLAGAMERAQIENIQLQIKTDKPLQEGLRNNLVCEKWRPTYVLSLPECLDRLKFGNARSRHRAHWSVKRAKELGLAVRSAETESDLYIWYRLYLDTMRRNVVPPRSFKFFLSLWRNLQKSGALRLLLAEQQRDNGTVIVAGSIFLSMGNGASYAFTGCLTKNLCTHANDLILWEAIRQACREGYRFLDFGEVPEEHPQLVRFKTKWGAQPRPLYRYYSPFPEQNGTPSKPRWLRYVLNSAWQLVPLSVTAMAGDWIYSYL